MKLHVQRTQVLGLPMLAGIRQQLNRMEAESKSKTSDDKYLAKIIGQEIQRAMMAVNEGVTVKAVIDSLMERWTRTNENVYSEERVCKLLHSFGLIRVAIYVERLGRIMRSLQKLRAPKTYASK